MFNETGNRLFAYSLFIKTKRGSGASLQCLATLRIYYQNNPFLGMFQLKFGLNTYETCSLLYVCVFKFSILAWASAEVLLDTSAKRGP